MFDFKNASDALEWLRVNRDEPFCFIWSGNQLIIGTRNDDGEIDAWKCAVVEHLGDITRKKATRGRGKGRKVHV